MLYEVITPPTNEAEEKLVEIWQEVLGIEKAGRNTNFFNHGGDSIKAITLLNKVNRILEVNILVKDIYVNQTVRDVITSYSIHYTKLYD